MYMCINNEDISSMDQFRSLKCHDQSCTDNFHVFLLTDDSMLENDRVFEFLLCLGKSSSYN
jgi:hypothetical protein